VTAFDRFASWCSRQVSRAPFFLACVLLIVLWGPSILLLGNVDTWQLIINTVTTIVTFLLVSLMQNGQQQFENAVHVKLDSIAEALKGLQDTHDDLLDRAIGAERETGA
jgi:low affinity Fe/Cu permease